MVPTAAFRREVDGCDPFEDLVPLDRVAEAVRPAVAARGAAFLVDRVEVRVLLVAALVLAGLFSAELFSAELFLAGLFLAGLFSANVFLAGLLVAGLLVAGLLVAGLLLAGLVAAGLVVAEPFAAGLPVSARSAARPPVRLRRAGLGAGRPASWICLMLLARSAANVTADTTAPALRANRNILVRR